MLLGALAGCSPDWGESTLRIEYYESDRGKVSACAELSASVEHRVEKAAPRLIEVKDVEVNAATGGVWEIGGMTLVHRSSGDEHYSWTCQVTIDRDRRTLDAELLSFQRMGQ